jgi:hypothetical protein
MTLLTSPRPLLSICIPTLNAGEPYRRLVASIRAHTSHIDHEIVTVISGAVTGYTAPQNEAMSAGRGEFLVAMNDDVEVAPGWIDPLLAHAQIWTPGAGPEAVCAWCVTPAEDQTGPVLLFAPHCMLWRADAWREIGGLDERFVHWASDLDLAMRLYQAGHPPVLVSLPEPVRHEVSATSRPELGPICMADLNRFRAKWGVDTETAKHRMAELWAGGQLACPS